jgi:hypothetical protein
MAVKKVIELEVDVDNLEKSISEIQKDFKELKESVQGFDETSKKTNDNLEKGFQGVNNQVVSLQKGFTGLALALKSIGIGLVLEAFNTLKSVFVANQTVSDGFRKSFLFVVNLFNSFVNFVTDKFEPTGTSLLNLFVELTKKVVVFGAALIGSLFVPLKKITTGLGALLKGLLLAMGGVTGFAQASLEFKKAAENLGGAFDLLDIIKFTDELTGGIGGLEDFIQGLYDAADATVELDKKARKAAAEQEGIRLKALTAQEKERRVRDDIRNDIELRIQANDRLAKLQNEQIKREQALADLQVAAATAARVGQEKNLDLEIAEIEAKNRKLEIDERILAQTSEQRANDAALQKEKLDGITAELDLQSQLRVQGIQARMEVEDGILDRLKLEQELADEEVRIATEKFNKTKELFDENTIEYKNALAEQTAATERAKDVEVKVEKLTAEAKRQIVADALGGISELLGQESVAGKAAAVAQSIINTYQGATKALGQGGIFGAIAAAGVIASGMASVKKIIATKVPGEDGSAGAAAITGVGAQVQSLEENVPDFNVVGASPINQIAQSLNNQQPVKAYVVSGDVTTAQQLDRNIINESGI